MSEVKRTFLQGKMNKDVDERLVPDGQYVDALNVQIAKSEGSDVGAIENSLGNEQKTTHNLTNAACIGKYADDSNQLIYYFVTADEKDFVAEYDDNSESSTMLLESLRVNGKTKLNFQKDKLITGVVKIKSGTGEDDLLGWSDDNEQPRIINIERAKGYGVDGFEEDDISLIKKPPIFAPETVLTYVEQDTESNINDKFLSFAYAYRYLDGEMSALSPFTTAAFSPNKFKLDYQTFENEGMQNIFSAVDIKFDTGSKRVTDIMLVFKESNSETPYVVETFNKKDNEWGDNEEQSFRFSNSKIYRVLDQNELYRLFDAVPRKAKAMDVIGNRIVFGNYLEGYDLKDKFGERLKIDYEVSLFTKDLTDVEIPTELLTLSVENDLITFDLTDVELNEGSRLSFEIDIIEKDNGGDGTFNGNFDFILNRDYNDVADLATDSEFNQLIQEVMTDIFLSDYTNTPPVNSAFDSNTTFSVDSYTPTSFTLKTPSITYEIDNTPGDPNDADFSYQTNNWGFTLSSNAASRESATDASCKTNRSYEVAIIYLDEYGRATTALTCPENTLFIPQKNSIYQNKIRVNVNHKVPSWAQYFRFGVKENKKEYQTIYVSKFYEDGLYRWIKLEGANKDKVKEGDTLIVKSDLSGPVLDVVKVRVLELKTEDEDFLTGNTDTNGDPIIEEAGLYFKIKPGRIDMEYTDDTFKTLIAPIKKTKKTRPVIVFGPLGDYTADGTYSDFEMNAGSEVRLEFRNWQEDSSNFGLDDQGPDYRYDKEFRVQADYTNFQEWFEAEVKELVSGEGEDFVNWEFEFKRVGADNVLELHVTGEIEGHWLTPSKMAGTMDFRFTEGIIVFETLPEDALSEVFFEGTQTFTIANDQHTGNIQDQTTEQPAIIELDFFNCYAQGNGVESYRYKDALNAKYLSIDTRPTAKSESEYREIRRYADLTYSQPYVESVGLNGLNNFNQSLSNYKDDIVKKYGSIQKLYARDTDLLVFQEDKVSRVLYGKELIVGADGDSNVASIDKVLGTQIMYSGEHGISRNPESMAISGTRIWWTDEKRNQVCRLSLDGVTVISEYGLTSFFRNMFTQSMNKAKIGSYDPYNQKYVLASNKQTIYIPNIEIDCSNSLSKKNFSGQLSLKVDFGLYTGDAGISITTDKEITVNLIWNETVFSVTTSGSDSILFDKTAMLPRTAEIVVTANNEDTNFSITGNCVVVDQLTVIGIVRGNEADAGTILDNRYKWVAGEYASPYKHFREEFIEGGGITVWNVENGPEGSGFIPLTGSKVLMESYKGYNDTGSFGDDDIMGYLVSNTEYSQADIETIVANMTTPAITNQQTAGGEVINKTSFDFLRPGLEQYLYLVWDYSSLSININTYIFIYFDSSGSMSTTLAPLQEMRDTLLKDALLPLYENDEARYDAQVQVLSHSSERTLHMLNFLNGVPPEGNVITLVFQDESDNTGQLPSGEYAGYYDSNGWTIYTTPTQKYLDDIAALRSRLSGFNTNYYRGVVFQVATNQSDGAVNFKDMLQAIENGNGQYAGSNGLSDKEEVNYKYDITPGSTPQYYKDQIVTALRELGYNL